MSSLEKKILGTWKGEFSDRTIVTEITPYGTFTRWQLPKSTGKEVVLALLGADNFTGTWWLEDKTFCWKIGATTSNHAGALLGTAIMVVSSAIGGPERWGIKEITADKIIWDRYVAWSRIEK